jgi:SNF2 family DNA or RNA helicase
MPWWAFLSARPEINEVIAGFSLSSGRDYEVSEEAARLLVSSRERDISYEGARAATPIPAGELNERLASVGFQRSLSAEQLRNVSILSSLPAAATFSVPGAGKTTEALAFFFYRAKPGDQLLVVAPKNAFGTWEEQLEQCLPDLHSNFVRLRGKDKIAELLRAEPRFMLITYQQLTRSKELIAAYLAEHSAFVFLDESHRIKTGADQTIQAALSIAHLAVGKLILSGTPMPQSESDLIPQFTFLYPEIETYGVPPVQLMNGIYVRTNKRELGLPPVTRRPISVPMAPIQAELYELMRRRVADEAASALSAKSRSAFRALGRSVARLLQFVSNPALLAQEIAGVDRAALSAVLAEGDSPKLRYVVGRTRQLAKAGKKVLIWSSFVENVEILAQRLTELGALFIHGGVDTGDEEDDDTREGKIRRFHFDPSVRVLIANPAAASEGISLHTICHHAIYIDRTFNAAHYLQSEDRIHRFGLSSDQETIIEIVESPGTIDEAVRTRLEYKVGRMAEALNDPSLHIEPEPYDPPPSDDPAEDVVGKLTTEDATAVLSALRSEEQ